MSFPQYCGLNGDAKDKWCVLERYCLCRCVVCSCNICARQLLYHGEWTYRIYQHDLMHDTGFSKVAHEWAFTSRPSQLWHRCDTHQLCCLYFFNRLVGTVLVCSTFEKRIHNWLQGIHFFRDVHVCISVCVDSLGSCSGVWIVSRVYSM